MKMKLEVLDKTGTKVSDIELDLKTSDIREDIFKRAIFAENSLFYQEKGADPMAGKRQTIHLSKRRKRFRTTYGKGQSRTPRKIMWSRGMQLRMVGALAPNTVGGRKAHAPKAWKNITKDINNREWARAFQTGILAAMDRGLVSKNGLRVPDRYPFVLDDSVESLAKTKDIMDMLTTLGFGSELERTAVRKVRAGRGTMRNRTYKTKRGPLLVVSAAEAPVVLAAKNVMGFDILPTDMLFVSDFGMSEKPGRAVLFTKKALEEVKEAMQ